MINAARERIGTRLLLLLMAATVAVTAFAPALVLAVSDEPDGHLVISEVSTGGGSASDELIEIYNPTAVTLPLEGLELVYASATGLTVSRRAAWDAGAPSLGPGQHVLVAHEAGIFAPLADATYASGMAATGGSVALRIQGASSAIDAVGWGTAANAWMEGSAAAAPPAGGSIERLPGGTGGSMQDTDDNAADFVPREVADPRNMASAPVPGPGGPSGTAVPTETAAASASAPPSPTPSAAPTQSPTPTAEPTASAAPAVPISTARTLLDGTTVTVEAVALTDSAFADGGGFVADATGGIAVLVTDGSYARGELLRVTGEVDDRFAQRTIRADASDLAVLGSAPEPDAAPCATAAVGESLEGALVVVEGRIAGSPTALSAGLAFELDDGTGPARVLVAGSTAIDTAAWVDGAWVRVAGVVGQRDSSGTGTAGYRVQPRDAADILSVTDPDASPVPTDGEANPSLAPTATPGDTPPPGVVTIAAARGAAKNARVTVRGTVTLTPGTVNPVTAAIQDASGAILIRVGEEVGPLVRGERIELDGVRSTLAGMETLRVTEPPRRLGSGSEPAFVALRTGDAGEPNEAQLVSVRGAVTAGARRASSGTVSFEIDDGSGPIRVQLGAALDADTDRLIAGAWIEVRGVLGQETTGAQPLRGYRVWPRAASEVVVLAAPTGQADGGDPMGGASGTAGGEPSRPVGGLKQVGGEADRIAATLVAANWPELGVAGILWDGERVVGVARSSAAALDSAVGDWRGPRSLVIEGLRPAGSDAATGLPLVALGDGAGDTVADGGPPAPPHGSLPDDGRAAWVSLVGTLAGGRDAPILVVGGRRVTLELRCDDAPPWPARRASLTGLAIGSPPVLVLPCEGVRAAPALDRGHGPAELTPSASQGASGTSAPDAGSEGGHHAAAGLLGAASVLLGGVAVAARVRRQPDPTNEPETSDEIADGPALAPAPPVLTLVPMHRERGP